MKRAFYLIPALVIMLAGCDTPPATTPSPVTSESPDVFANAICNEISFLLEPDLASGYVCETVPESTDEFEPYPQHTRVTLEGYPVSGAFFSPQISVYPVDEYTALVPDRLPGLVADLQAHASGAVVPVFTGSFSAGPPFLPVFNAAQVFFVQHASLAFADGGGVRFLTEYAQSYKTVNNVELFYTYQGLTDDGQYWVSAILPINLPGLPANANDLPNGQTMDDFISGYEAYLAGMVDQLNVEPSTGFSPTVGALDALVSSIAIES